MPGPGKSQRPPTRRVGLQLKLVCALVGIAMVPLLVSAVLIEQTAEVAHNFASNETAFLRPPLEQARSAYAELIATKRALYHEVALRLVALPEVVALAQAAEHAAAPSEAAPEAAGATAEAAAAVEPQVVQRLDELLASTPELRAIAITSQDDAVLVRRERPDPHGTEPSRWRRISITEPIAGTRAVLTLAFAASIELEESYIALSQAIQRAERIDEVRSALPSSYRVAFWMLVGGVIALVSLTGIVMARRFTARIGTLVSGTRRVAAGDLTSRVELEGRDELAELAWAFNLMIDELEHDREQIAYLQRIGAWQDVARKLAHEIKNPLTPIQLAVQQVVSSYRGDDPRFQRLLGDTEEIVTEEIASLRRLVDAFRTLGQLPRVDARPMDLSVVVEDLTRDPAFAERLELHAPAEPVMVHGDRQLLRRVLVNLVENGLQAGAAAGQPGRVVIDWHADRDSARAVLTVDDDGPGVPETMREKIFEPYVTGKENGTGLGLTICKKIVLEHKGALAVWPEPAPTGGARFILSLPLAPDGEASTAGAQGE